MANETERRIGNALIKESLDRNNALTQKVHDILMGNGGPGVLTRMAVMGTKIKILLWTVSLLIGSVVAWAMKEGLG